MWFSPAALSLVEVGTATLRPGQVGQEPLLPLACLQLRLLHPEQAAAGLPDRGGGAGAGAGQR